MARKCDPHEAHQQVLMIHDLFDLADIAKNESPGDPKSHELSAYDRAVSAVQELKRLREQQPKG